MTCAIGLPGAESINIPQCLRTLDKWTDGVKRYTQDNMEDYYRAPALYRNHRGFFRFISLVTFLKHPRGMGVAYQPTAIGNYDLSDSRDDLIHGLLTRRTGTCASMPVLFTAIGRRLGYPMYLALALGHVLCQWNSEGRRINLEGSGGGGCDSFSDEYYHKWPHEMTPKDIASGRYLRPLTPSEELSMFLENRGHCFCDNRRYAEAEVAYRHAHRFAPHWNRYSLQMQRLGLCHDLDRRGIPRKGPQALKPVTQPLPIPHSFKPKPSPAPAFLRTWEGDSNGFRTVKFVYKYSEPKRKR